MKNILAIFLVSVFVVNSFANNCVLTDPMLQSPTASSVNVVWFTDCPGQAHYVEYGEDLSQQAVCTLSQLSRMREDSSDGHSCVFRSVYRHEAVLEGLGTSLKTPYRTVTVSANGDIIKSDIFQCCPAPLKGSALKILFTSDHQGKPMVAANLQKIKEVVPEIDAIFFAGDCVDHADTAAEWFGENGFFPCLQGNACKQLNSSIYTGGKLLQSAPMFCAIGNHEVMGRWSDKSSLDEQFNDPYPKELAELQYEQIFLDKIDLAGKEKWIKDHSFNSDSYEEIFTLPQSISGGKKYYAVSYGDVRLVVLHATRIWRQPQIGVKGKYTESAETFDLPSEWGYGDFIFEPVQKGTAQYNWLEAELQSAEFQNAKYKIIMLHNPLHSLGVNSIPPFTNPVQQIERDLDGEVTAISYHYPRKEDFLIRDLDPLFVRYGVDLVLCGHTHVWNRFCSPEGIHHLETSNVGNSYGAYIDHPRYLGPNKEGDNYRVCGDPNGFEPIVPTVSPLHDVEGRPMPYISSNSITVFSIFSTDTGAVDSYYFDTEKPDSSVVHFDRFYLGDERYTIRSIKDLQEWAEKTQLPDVVVFDIDNTLIESSRQIALDPSTNGFLRKQFPQNSEEMIKAIQSTVPWKLCEKETAQVVKFFQERGVKIVGVTKRSAEIRESVFSQLLENGINLNGSALATDSDLSPEQTLKVGSDVYYKGVLHAHSDKGTALKNFFQKINWSWKNRLIYFVDDRKSHLEDYHKAFQSEIAIRSFEYTYSHSQHVDEPILILQLQDFLLGKPIQEDWVYAK